MVEKKEVEALGGHVEEGEHTTHALTRSAALARKSAPGLTELSAKQVRRLAIHTHVAQRRAVRWRSDVTCLLPAACSMCKPSQGPVGFLGLIALAHYW